MRQFSLASFLSVVLLLSFATTVFCSKHPYIYSHDINFAIGNKYVEETDFIINTPVSSFKFTRSYNSQSSATKTLGFGWTHNFNETLLHIVEDNIILLTQSDGKTVHFQNIEEDLWQSGIGKTSTVRKTPDGFELKQPSGNVRIYDSAGKITETKDSNNNIISYSYNGDLLSTMTNSFGHTLTFNYSDNKLQSIDTPLGLFNYQYDDNNNLISVTKPDTSKRQYGYEDDNDPNNLTSITDEEGMQVQTLTYDEFDRVDSSTLAGGNNQLSFEYLENEERKITDSLGNTTTYQLTVSQGIAKISSFTGPCCNSCGDDSAIQYTYNERQQLLTAIDEAGIVTSYTYDDAGNLLTKTEAAGTPLARTSTRTYTAENKLHTLTKKSVANPTANVTTTREYDVDGNLLSTTTAGFSGTTATTRTTSYTYNSLGKITSIDGPKAGSDDVTTFTYFANEANQGSNRGRLHTITNSLGHVTTFSNYNIFGHAEKITAPNQAVTNRSYSTLGLLLSSETGGLTTSYSYDKTGKILNVAQPGGAIITYTYTAGNKIETISDTLGNKIQYTYESEGRRTGEDILDPSGNLTKFSTFEYNSDGKISKLMLPGDAEETYQYDDIGNLVTTTDPLGSETGYNYDVLGRLISQTENTSVTAYTYDIADNATLVTDARNNSTQFSYDDFGNIVQRTAPDTGTTRYSYDTAGNLISITDAKEQTITFSYDLLNRITSQQYPNGIGVDYVYDQNGSIGALTTIQDGFGGINYTYDTLGRLTAEARTLSSLNYTTRYNWEAESNNLAGMIYPSGLQVSYVRNSSGSIVELQLNGEAAVSGISYLPFGPIKTLQYGAGTVSKTHDKRYQVMQIEGQTLNYIYSRDVAGQVTSIDNYQAPSVNSLETEYIYNPDNNQLENITSAQEKNYSYDANGNISSDSEFDYLYDALNRLVRVEKNGLPIGEYVYDSQNRRVAKTANGITTHYHYDNYGQLIAESSDDGTFLREYIYLESAPVLLIEHQENPGVYFYINDHLGTPQQLIDDNGFIVWKAAYFPFGKAQIQVETVTNNIRFPGQYYDLETGLHYNWHRFYDPSTGRYISADLIGLAGGMNLYAYVGGDPVNWIDNKGLFGAGGPDSDWPGHNDMPGGTNGGGDFDYSIEDEGETGPFVDPERHFRPIEQSERDVQEAINNCDRDAFRRAMHRGHDYFSHYRKGYRWDPWSPSLPCWGFGHGCDGTKPDEDLFAYWDAYDWSQGWWNKWKEKCECE